MAFTRKNLIYATGLFWLTAQLYCAFQPVDAMLMRAILLSCSLAIAFLAKPFSGTSNRYINIIIDTSGYFISIGVLLYIALNTTRLSSRIPYVDEIFSLDIALCILYVILIFETGRRYLGWSMNVVCLIFLVYGFFGANLPSIFTHSGIDLHVFTEVQFLTTGGIFSSPIATTVSYCLLLHDFWRLPRWQPLQEHYSPHVQNTSPEIRWAELERQPYFRRAFRNDQRKRPG